MFLLSQVSMLFKMNLRESRHRNKGNIGNFVDKGETTYYEFKNVVIYILWMITHIKSKDMVL